MRAAKHLANKPAAPLVDLFRDAIWCECQPSKKRNQLNRNEFVYNVNFDTIIMLTWEIRTSFIDDKNIDDFKVFWILNALRNCI